MSTRNTCKHCGQVILYKRDLNAWFSNPVGDPWLGSRCDAAPDKRHTPASADQEESAELLRLRARVAELEAELKH